MALPTRRVPPRALTASATRLTYNQNAYSKRLTMPWQLRALIHYDLIGEIRFASQFYAKKLSRVRFYPATLEPSGDTTPIESGPPLELLNRIQDPAGGRSRMQYDYGRLMFVTGEGLLFGSRLNTDEEQWRFLWKDEIKIEENGVAIRIREDKQPVEPIEAGVAYRMWNPHPRHSDLPDSPLHGVSAIAEELIALTDSVMATATTRMTNGILYHATEMSPNPAEVIGDEDPENNIWVKDWIEHTQAQITNPADPASKVPFIVEGGYEYADGGIKWIPTHNTETDYMEKDLRTEAVKRMALGLDFPPEFLLGMTDANHWTAKQVVWDMWQSYGAPMAEAFADDLNQAYLRPALRAEGAAWENVVIAYDDSQVVISPDRTQDADSALDRIAINREGYRKLKGIPESMAPDEEEEAFLASLKIRKPVEMQDGELVLAQSGPAPAPASSNGNAETGPATPQAGRLGTRQESRTASARVEGAAELALHRCRELAGIRIRHAAQNAKVPDPCPDCTNSLIASTMGAERITDPMKLVKGGTDNLMTLLAEWRFDPAQARSLCQDLELYAARTLFHPSQPELPSGFIASIQKAREVSDALGAEG